MSRKVREIIKIDESLCDGCGQCILDCAEGALQIIDGKAKLISETLCDGFGNCVGSCPQDAITIIKREADEFDEAEVEKHLADQKQQTIEAKSSDTSLPVATPTALKTASPTPGDLSKFSGCPGSAMRSFEAESPCKLDATAAPDERPSTLTQWPVQLMLVPPHAPFLKGRDILLAADCCPFAYADFHRKYLKDKALLVGCPKLDDINHYRQKLEEIFRESECTGIMVMIMEVPCCKGLDVIAREALAATGRDIPLKVVVVGIRGEILGDA
jgi:ferredoxin